MITGVSTAHLWKKNFFIKQTHGFYCLFGNLSSLKLGRPREIQDMPAINSPFENSVNIKFNQFLANISILLHLKTVENQTSSGVFQGYKLGTLARHGLSITPLYWVDKCQKLLKSVEKQLNSLWFTFNFEKRASSKHYSKLKKNTRKNIHISVQQPIYFIVK